VYPRQHKSPFDLGWPRLTLYRCDAKVCLCLRSFVTSQQMHGCRETLLTIKWQQIITNQASHSKIANMQPLQVCFPSTSLNYDLRRKIENSLCILVQTINIVENWLWFLKEQGISTSLEGWMQAMVYTKNHSLTIFNTHLSFMHHSGNLENNFN
jgi:hypothetical protein